MDEPGGTDNAPPVVEAFSTEVEVGVTGHPLPFSWIVSDPDDDSLACTLDPGNEVSNIMISDCSSNTSTTHTYDVGGDFTAVLHVEDDDGDVTQEATTATIMTKLFPSDGSIDKDFGESVAISGDTLVIGAFEYNLDDEGPGSAYVFVHDGTAWTEQAKLTAGDGGAPDWFGRAVAIDDDTIVVGAALGGDSGAAYVFARTGSTWAQVDKLTASDAADVRRFGSSVAIDGRVVVVGASASAYVYAGSGTDFTEVDKLSSDYPDTYGSFGFSVAAHGDRVVVGAPYEELGTGADVGEGAVYVYHCVQEAAPAQSMPRPQCTTRWVQEQRLVASDAVERDAFGSAVAFDGATLVVGAPRKDARGENSGMVYSFTHSGTAWSEEDAFTADDGSSSDFFGRSVALQGDTIVVGAASDDDRGSRSGSVYTFARNGSAWAQRDKLTAADGAAGDRFGQSVGSSGSTVVIGTGADDDLASDEGFAYVLGP